jgi:hypothetical protein
MADRSNRRPVRKVVAGVSVAAIAAVTLLVSTTAALSTFADGEHSKFEIQSAPWTRAQPRVEPEPQPTVTPSETWDVHSADPTASVEPSIIESVTPQSTPTESPSPDPTEESSLTPTPTATSYGESVS